CLFPEFSGTGALAIFLHKSFQLDITTSDYDDAEIEENIAHNCQINGVTPVLPHIKHTWGDAFPISDPCWDLIIASDILLCKYTFQIGISTLDKYSSLNIDMLSSCIATYF
ncbi:uncharacterized protein LOC111384686, partial [Olea europaea var. sylvestris]|uniref:uncharacterized protein LOC111384686 n=1 Tax=Olea europaea var. sylvestris TaxID=158386 RepID=UPI000C1D27B2